MRLEIGTFFLHLHTEYAATSDKLISSVDGIKTLVHSAVVLDYIKVNGSMALEPIRIRHCTS